MNILMETEITEIFSVEKEPETPEIWKDKFCLHSGKSKGRFRFAQRKASIENWIPIWSNFIEMNIFLKIFLTFFRIEQSNSKNVSKNHEHA